MGPCAVRRLHLLLLPLLLAPMGRAWVATPRPTGPSSRRFAGPAQTVEVCHGKDCKRVGGGARLLQTVQQILEETDAATGVQAQACDCQGECGYGPNLVVDGAIVNGVRGKAAILQALGLEEEEEVVAAVAPGEASS